MFREFLGGGQTGESAADHNHPLRHWPTPNAPAEREPSKQVSVVMALVHDAETHRTRSLRWNPTAGDRFRATPSKRPGPQDRDTQTDRVHDRSIAAYGPPQTSSFLEMMHTQRHHRAARGRSRSDPNL